MWAPTRGRVSRTIRSYSGARGASRSRRGRRAAARATDMEESLLSEGEQSRRFLDDLHAHARSSSCPAQMTLVLSCEPGNAAGRAAAPRLSALQLLERLLQHERVRVRGVLRGEQQHAPLGARLPCPFEQGRGGVAVVELAAVQPGE